MAAAKDFYDSLETRAPEARIEAHLAALAKQVANAKANAPYYAKALADVEPAKIVDRDALAKLPVVRKSDLIALQSENAPFGGLTAVADGALSRIFQSPGPIYDPEGREADFWRTGRALFAAGFRAGDVVHNTFAYHLTPGGFIMESGCRAVGCAVIPAGVGQTEQQLQVISAVRPTGYAGTPSFLKILLEKGREAGVDVSSITKGLCSGEALPPSLRDQFKDQGISVYQAYATADLGLIGYESEAMEGLIVDEGVLVEIVRPGTGEPVAEDEVGEVVVTNLSSTSYPLIRFATGDLSAVLAGTSPCGRTNMRIKGWMGRADQTTKIKGMFVHPQQVAEVARRHPEIAKARLVVTRSADTDAMALNCESAVIDDALAAKVADSLQAVCKMRGSVELVSPGSLPNDGKVIDDQRSYD